MHLSTWHTHRELLKHEFQKIYAGNKTWMLNLHVYHSLTTMEFSFLLFDSRRLREVGRVLLVPRSARGQLDLKTRVRLGLELSGI